MKLSLVINWFLQSDHLDIYQGDMRLVDPIDGSSAAFAVGTLEQQQHGTEKSNINHATFLDGHSYCCLLQSRVGTLPG